MKKDELGIKLISSIEKSGGSEIISSITEIGLDGLIEEGVLCDIPVLNAIVGLYKIGVGVKGYLFLKKLHKFLFHLQDVSDKERKEFTNRLDSDKKHRKKVGETIVMILDRLDDIEKSEYIARAFKGYIREEYDFLTFQRLARAVESCFILDFGWIKVKKKYDNLEAHIAMPLTSVGIIELIAIPGVRDENTNNVYKLSNFGKLFVGVVIEGKTRFESDV